MTTNKPHYMLVFLVAVVAAFLFASINSYAAVDSKEELNQKSQLTLQTLLKRNTSAAALSKQAEAILVFPNILKAGLVFGGGYGEGVLIEKAR